MLALLVADREERLSPSADGAKNARKTEIVLSGSGLSPAEIAQLVGKNLAAVQKTIQRGGK
jgi:DNA-directed RNA polymerase specialized sigma24 family protein